MSLFLSLLASLREESCTLVLLFLFLEMGGRWFIRHVTLRYVEVVLAFVLCRLSFFTIGLMTGLMTLSFMIFCDSRETFNLMLIYFC